MACSYMNYKDRTKRRPTGLKFTFVTALWVLITVFSVACLEFFFLINLLILTLTDDVFTKYSVLRAQYDRIGVLLPWICKTGISV